MNTNSLEPPLNDEIVQNIKCGDWPTVLDRLQYCVENGLLLHGSSLSSIDVLRGKGKRPVCATNIPTMAILYAIMPDDHLLPISERELVVASRRKIVVEENPFSLLEVWEIKAPDGFAKKLGNGSVYVVESGPFRQGKDKSEYVTFEPVRPIARIDMEPDDLPCQVERLPKLVSDHMRAEILRKKDTMPW